MSDIYIFGDIGGHFEPFMRALAKLGVDTDDHVIPKGVIVVQVGDLVHRGPMSDELVAWVDAVIKVNNSDPERGQWIQLLGNHEGHHIGGPQFGQTVKGQYITWHLAHESEQILKKWYHSGQALMALAIERDDTPEPREVLVSHAGLCFQAWAGLGFPDGAAATAKVINAQPLKLAFAPGWLLGGYMKSPSGDMQPPGVAWASAAKEVYPSWVDRDGMFDQVHGHSTVWNWWSKQWYVDDEIASTVTRRPKLRFTKWTNKNGNHYYCIDQALGRDAPSFEVEPLKMSGRVLEPAVPHLAEEESEPCP